MPAPPDRVILIHGAWAGAWVWDALIPELGALGWDAEGIELPGNGHHAIPLERTTEADLHAALTDAIHARPGRVALVGHSGGGMLVTAGAMAHPGRVSHGIWIAGMLIPDGRSFDDIQDGIAGPGRRFGVTPHVVPTPDGLGTMVPVDKAVEYFFHDVDPDTAMAAAMRLTAQPNVGRRLRTVCDAAFGDLPKLYIAAHDDRSVLPEAQRVMAASACIITLQTIQSGHAPQVTQAPQLAQMISDWLAR